MLHPRLVARRDQVNVGAGVIGTVYGAHLAAAGNTVSVLSHGPRTDEVAAGGLSARDVLGGGRVREETAVVPDASGDYDVVLVAVRSDQLASACAGLAGLASVPSSLDGPAPPASVRG
jgi:2-dehydropantoate 2-reductase